VIWCRQLCLFLEPQIASEGFPRRLFSNPLWTAADIHPIKDLENSQLRVQSVSILPGTTRIQITTWHHSISCNRTTTPRNYFSLWEIQYWPVFQVLFSKNEHQYRMRFYRTHTEIRGKFWLAPLKWLAVHQAAIFDKAIKV
jgi:hypothetical protein